MTKKQVLIAEDNTLLREGLRIMVEGTKHLEIAGEARDGMEAISLCRKLNPDIVLLDLSMPKLSGISAIKEIRRESPETRIMALTIHESEEYILESFAAGAQGYCVKDITREDLLTAIDVVLSGKTYISPSIADKVMVGYIEGRKTMKTESSWEQVTPREKEILKMVGEGYTSKEIANYLNISPKTVEKHRSNLMNKLEIHNVSELTAFAIEKGLVNK